MHSLAVQVDAAAGIRCERGHKHGSGWQCDRGKRWIASHRHDGAVSAALRDTKSFVPCRARHRLYGDDYEHNELGYTDAILRIKLLADADADPEYRMSVEAWRACMRGRRFDEGL